MRYSLYSGNVRVVISPGNNSQTVVVGLFTSPMWVVGIVSYLNSECVVLSSSLMMSTAKKWWCFDGVLCKYNFPAALELMLFAGC